MESKMLLRIGICAALVVAGLGGFYYFWWAPVNAQDATLRTGMESRQRDLKELDSATASIEDLNKRIKEQQEAIKYFQAKLPQERELETILDSVWKKAEANSLQAKTIRAGKTDRNSSYSEQQVEISLAGDFNGFYLFLQELEKMERLTKVTDMSLSKISEHDGQMQAKLTLNVYFEPAQTGGQQTAGAM